MAKIGLRVSYWDSCIALAWLNNSGRELEKHGQDALDAIDEQVTKFDKGSLHIASSVLLLPEVLESDMLLGNKQKFQELFEHPNFHLIDTNKRIAAIAHDLRDYYRPEKDGLDRLSVPDAIHLATAIWFQCNEFYTFDGTSHKPHPRKRKILPLSGVLAEKYMIKIEIPKMVQPALFSPSAGIPQESTEV